MRPNMFATNLMGWSGLLYPNLFVICLRNSENRKLEGQIPGQRYYRGSSAKLLPSRDKSIHAAGFLGRLIFSRCSQLQLQFLILSRSKRGVTERELFALACQYIVSPCGRAGNRTVTEMLLPFLVRARPNCARQSLASTQSAPCAAATSYWHPGRHANVVTPVCFPPV